MTMAKETFLYLTARARTRAEKDRTCMSNANIHKNTTETIADTTLQDVAMKQMNLSTYVILVEGSFDKGLEGRQNTQGCQGLVAVLIRRLSSGVHNFTEGGHLDNK